MALGLGGAATFSTATIFLKVLSITSLHCSITCLHCSIASRHRSIAPSYRSSRKGASALFSFWVDNPAPPIHSQPYG